jgi:LacI family transcriptional regulator
MNIKTLAKLAGVSPGTIDRVINNRGGVKKETEDRIRKIIKEYNYKPNRAGKALAIHKSKPKLGVVINSIGNQFYDEVLRGIQDIEKEYADYGLNIIIKKIKGYNVKEQVEAIDGLVRENVKGIAITPIDDIMISNKINELFEKSIPVVLVNSNIEDCKKIAYVGCDYYKSGETAAGLMGSFVDNKSNIAIITGSCKMLGHNRRVKGFVELCKKEFSSINIVDIKENNDDDIVSYKVTKDLIKNHPEINGFYFAAAGVNGGIIAINECYENKKRPIIITCDDTEQIKELLLDGEIKATVCQEPYLQGYRALKLLFEYEFNDRTPDHKVVYTKNEIKLKYNI